MTSSSNDDVDVRRVIVDWHRAIVRRDVVGVVAAHTDDIVMFDVPPPERGARRMRRPRVRPRPVRRTAHRVGDLRSAATYRLRGGRGTGSS